MKGKFITIYGMNNLGKTAILDGLIPRLEKKGLKVLKLKYPIYGLEPTGPRLNTYLRAGNPENLTAFDVQKVYSQNRRDYEIQLIKNLEDYDLVIAEDYIGTGLAWGQIFGVSLVELEKINEGLRKTDLAILVDGERFKGGIETSHKYEGVGDEVWNNGRKIYLDLAKRYGWKLVKVVFGELDREISDIEKLIVG